MEEQDKLARFEHSIMPHMDAAYNLARWLAGNEPDAQDVVQEAFIRVHRAMPRFRIGKRFYTWFYQIVVQPTTVEPLVIQNAKAMLGH